MTDESSLSRRERQIMDVLYAKNGASTMEVVAELPDRPSDLSIRRLLHILVEKGHVRRRKRGREVVYIPKKAKRIVGAKALKHVVDTFFEGSLDEALEVHLTRKETSLTPEQLERIQQLITKAKEEGR